MDPTKQTEIWTDIDEATMPDNAAANRQADRGEQASATKNAGLPGVAGSCTSQTANGRLQSRFKPFHQAAKIVGPEGKAIGVDMTDAMIQRARDNAAAARNTDSGPEAA